MEKLKNKQNKKESQSGECFLCGSFVVEVIEKKAGRPLKQRYNENHECVHCGSFIK